MAITIGVVGCGQWGINHLRNFSGMEETHVAQACDVNPERLETVQRLHPGIQTVSEPEALFNDPSIDAVVVATPTSTHFDVAKAALERGKDVLCEKPLTTSVAECEKLIRLAERQKRILMVGHVFVFNPAIQKLHEFVHANGLGRLYYMSARRTNLGPIRADVDAIWDLASHDLSIFDYLLDGVLPQQVSACGGAFLTPKRADIAFVSLEYPQHIVANIHVSWLDPQKRREVTIVGSEKMAIFNDVSMEAPLWIYDKGAKVGTEPYQTFEQFRVIPWERDATVPKIPNVEPLLNETRHFLDCVKRRQTPKTDGHNALRTIRILEAISRSMSKGGAPSMVAPS